MKKYVVITLFAVSVVLCGNTLAQLNPGIGGVNPRDFGPSNNPPIDEIQTFLRYIISLLALIFTVPAMIGLYLTPSLAIHHLGKKYTPEINPNLAWIPIAQLYTLTKVTGLHGGWAFSFLSALIGIPVYVYVFHHLAKKLGKGVGTTLGLVFLTPLVLPYVALRDIGKSTWPAWVFGGSVIMIFVIFFGWTITRLVFHILGVV